ncbi:hypothetical protein Tco_0173292 [Tanacetum coccineum]
MRFRLSLLSRHLLVVIMLKPPRTQDTFTEDGPSDRGSNEGKDAARNKLNEDANPNKRFPYDRFDVDDCHNEAIYNDVESASFYYKAEVRNTARDKIGNELLHLAPGPYYMPYPYDEGLGSNPPNMENGISHGGEMNMRYFSLVGHCDILLARCQQLANDLKEQTLIIVYGANHALEKENHSRCKKYKKYKTEIDSLVLEKEKLENKLLEIHVAFKQDKESFAKGKYQLDLQETELKDLKHRPSIKQSETYKLKNAIIDSEKDLFKNFSKRTSRDLFKNSSRVASSPKHLLVSSHWRLVPNLNERDAYSPVTTLCLHLLLPMITPSLRGRYCTIAPEEVKN